MPFTECSQRNSYASVSSVFETRSFLRNTASTLQCPTGDCEIIYARQRFPVVYNLTTSSILHGNTIAFRDYIPQYSYYLSNCREYIR